MNDGEAITGESSHDAPRDESRAAVFVSDPSAEAERVAQQLRSAGYIVVDVPLSMLAARVAVQTPCAIIVDADAAEVDQALVAVRRSGGRAHLDIVLLGQEADGKAEKLAAEDCHFFARPVDPGEIVREIDALTGGPDSAPPQQPARSSSPPFSQGPPTTMAQAWPQVIPDHRSPVPSGPPSSPQSVRPASSPSPHHDPPMSARSVRPAVSIRTALSAELEALLLEAEQRVGGLLANEAAPPTPEEEIEAVLPEALLAALDEPIDDDEEDAPGDLPRSRAMSEPSQGSLDPAAAETNAGRALTPRPPQALPAPPPTTAAFGVAPTMPPPMPADDILDLEVPAPAAVPIERPVVQPEISHFSPPSLLGPEGAARMLAGAIASRKSGCLTIEAETGLRRVVLRDGDLVMAASSADDETLLAFLSLRGDLRREQVKDLVGKVPPFGRHAGAALVGHGILRQDQLWPILRAHAEWTVGRLLLAPRGTSRFDDEAPGRLKQEPSVFGGSSGAEVLVEVTRRVVAPEEALRRLGGESAVVSDGPGPLLAECALEGHDRSVVEQARGLSLEELISAGSDMASVLYALSLLGVVTVTAAARLDFAARAGRPSVDVSSEAVDALDLAAVRERVRARSDLVAEADYFTLLGVPREATGYEVRRAYLELRRSFEPTQILTPELADLEADVRTIVLVLDEAYEILRDGVRRERYRRALGS